MKKKRRVRRKLRLDRIFFLLTLIFLVGFLVYYLFNYKKLEDNNSNNNEVEENNTVIDEDKVYEISIAMVGDALINDKVYNDANRYANYNGYDFKPMLTYVKDMISDYELAYYNQETILGGSEIGLSSYPAFNSPYELGDAMIDAGFNLVSLATNHTLDRGEKAVINSYNYWKSKDDVMTAGSYSSFDDRNKVQIKEVNNISYSLLSYTYGTNGITVPYGKEYYVNVWPTNGYDPNNDSAYQKYKETVREDVLRLRDNVDVLMVAMHWGSEYIHTPTSYQIDMANFLAELDVDIIIGSHPHVVMPITWIDDTLVIYSLGNFLSAQDTVSDYNTRIGLFTSIDIVKTTNGDDTNITLKNLNNELLFTYHDNGKNIKIIPFSNSDIKNYVSDYERLYNKYSAYVKSIDDSVSVTLVAD